MTFKSILKPSESTMASLATVGFVVAVYQMNTGNTAQVHASEPNHPVLESSRKKAGYMALAGVAALTLLTKDANIGILGGGTIIAMEVTTRHAIMAHPLTGKLTAPEGSAYVPAPADDGTVVQMDDYQDSAGYAR
jgi:hypothetical protein